MGYSYYVPTKKRVCKFAQAPILNQERRINTMAKKASPPKPKPKPQGGKKGGKGC